MRQVEIKLSVKEVEKLNQLLWLFQSSEVGRNDDKLNEFAQRIREDKLKYGKAR